MAINKKLNKRIDITLPNSQYSWVKEQAEKLGVSKSKFISWILARRIKMIVEELSIYNDDNYETRLEKIENDIETEIHPMTTDEIDWAIRQINLLNPKKSIK